MHFKNISNLRIHNERNLPPMCFSISLIEWTSLHREIIILSLNLTCILWSAIVTVWSVSHVVLKTIYHDVNFCIGGNFYWFLSTVLLEHYGKPFVFRVFFGIGEGKLMIIWFISIDCPSYGVLHVFLMVVSNDAKTMEVDISLWLETNCIPIWFDS